MRRTANRCWLVSHRTSRTCGGAVGEARRTGRVVRIDHGATEALVPTPGDEVAVRTLRELAPESAVVVPLLAGGDLVGLLSLVRGGGRPAHERGRATLAQEVARAGLALDNPRLVVEPRGLADRLQQALLTAPPSLTTCTWSCATSRLPAGPGRWVVVRRVPAARRGHDAGGR